MKHALVDAQNIVQNIVVHDPVKSSGWQPPEGLSLIEVSDWVNIGDNINKAAPPVPQPKDPAEAKAERDAAYKGNLALVAAYEIEKKANPDLKFGAYLDDLEAKSKSM